MANPTASQCEELWPQKGIPPICQILRLLYAHVTSPSYIHDTNPWSDSDPMLQTISTASLETLQGHADFHMQALLYVHELLEKELLDRKLVALTRLDRVGSRETPPEASNISEILFDVDDLEPLGSFLVTRDQFGNVHGSLVGERIDTMAKMAYAWIDGDRSAARHRTESKSRSSKLQIPRKAAVEARNEAGEDGGLHPEDQCVADMIQLEAEMDEFDLVDDGKSFSDMESTISSVDSPSPLLGGLRLGEAEVDEASVDRTNEVVGSATMANTEAGTRKGWLRWFAQ